jgi:hypothetical protein
MTTATQSSQSFSHVVQRKLRTALRLAGSWVYQAQVTYRFPTAKAVTNPEEIRLPPGFTLRNVSGPDDYPAWIDLLNKDKGFGHWDGVRLNSELIGTLLGHNSAGFLFKGYDLVGSAAICVTKFRGKRVPSGMFLIMDPAVRGDFKLAVALFKYNLWLAVREGYDHVYSSTFPDRLPALTLYLAHGAEPCHASLWSYVQWYRIHKRLARPVERLRNKLAK